MTTTQLPGTVSLPMTKAVATAPTTTKAVEKASQKRFIDILKTDHNFDIIKEIVDHIKLIKRSKKLKAKEKHTMISNYHLTLLTFCVPKQKIVEDRQDDSGKGVVFNINLGGEPEPQPKTKRVKGKASKPKTGINITIPTRQAADGTYSIDESNNPDS